MLLLKEELEKLRGCIRAGIIPYVKVDGMLYFLMGMDRKHEELSDFGGGIKNNETPPMAGKRELFEEVKELLTDKDISEIRCGIYDRHNSTCVMFCQILDEKVYTNIVSTFATCEKFGEQYNEMRNLVWIDLQKMIQLVYSPNSTIWSRIRFTLLNTGEFDSRLLSLL